MQLTFGKNGNLASNLYDAMNVAKQGSVTIECESVQFATVKNSDFESHIFTVEDREQNDDEENNLDIRDDESFSSMEDPDVDDTEEQIPNCQNIRKSTVMQKP